MKGKTERKSFKVGEEEYKQILRLRQISKEDKQRGRLESIKSNKRRITYAEREIEHRQDQIKTGISLEKHENYFDGKKPLFVLQSDIDETTNQIEQMKEIIKAAQEEYDKDDNWN